MDKTLLKIRKIASFMKKNGVLSLKTPEGIEISLSSESIKAPQVVEPEVEDETPEPGLTDEEVLLYSSPSATRVE